MCLLPYMTPCKRFQGCHLSFISCINYIDCIFNRKWCNLAGLLISLPTADTWMTTDSCLDQTRWEPKPQPAILIIWSDISYILLPSILTLAISAYSWDKGGSCMWSLIPKRVKIIFHLGINNNLTESQCSLKHQSSIRWNFMGNQLSSTYRCFHPSIERHESFLISVPSLRLQSQVPRRQALTILTFQWIRHFEK